MAWDRAKAGSGGMHCKSHTNREGRSRLLGTREGTGRSPNSWQNGVQAWGQGVVVWGSVRLEELYGTLLISSLGKGKGSVVGNGSFLHQTVVERDRSVQVKAHSSCPIPPSLLHLEGRMSAWLPPSTLGWEGVQQELGSRMFLAGSPTPLPHPPTHTQCQVVNCVGSHCLPPRWAWQPVTSHPPRCCCRSLSSFSSPLLPSLCVCGSMEERKV